MRAEYPDQLDYSGFCHRLKRPPMTGLREPKREKRERESRPAGAANRRKKNALRSLGWSSEAAPTVVETGSDRT